MRGRQDAKEGFDAMEEMQAAESSKPSPPKKWRVFTNQKTSAIRTYFSSNITNNQAPSMAACHSFQRSTKDIYDKVRNQMKH